MRRIKHNSNGKNVQFTVLFMLLAYVVTIGSVVSGAYVQSRDTIVIGRVAPKSYKATREVEDVITTNRKREVAANAVEPYYAINKTINDEVLQRLNDFFEGISLFRMEYMPIINPTEDVKSPVEVLNMDKSGLSVSLTDEQFIYMVTCESVLYIELKDMIISVTQSTLEAGINENDGLIKSIADVREIFNKLEWEDNVKTLGYDIVREMLRANRFIDEEQTNILRREKAAEIVPITYQEGQNIIAEGDIVTEEIYAVLDELDFVKKGAFDNFIPLAGALGVITIMSALFVAYAFYYHKELLSVKKRVILLFTLYSITILFARGMTGMPFPFIPALLFIMLISLLMDTQLAIVLSCCIAVNTAVICNADMKFLLYFLLNGLLVSVVAKYTTERNKVFSVGLLVSFIQVVTIAVICLLFDKRYTPEMLNLIIYAALAGVMTVILCIGSLPIWEAIFGVTTPIKLLELTNPSNALLRRLIVEAPGTYHHSLIVANLAETAAYAIGANQILARVGGYYHDIGKLKYPQYFAENQAGENLHDFMDPFTSAQVVIGHVTTGIAYAEDNNLPSVVTSFISEHHGSTLVKYFYYKAKKDNPDEEINIEDFRYPYKKPQSRETAIVMLADTVEAAVRSMIPSGKTTQEVEDFVKVLIKDKLDDGQLSDSGLKISDLDTAANAFMRVFKGMYHERIPYPTAAIDIKIKSEPEKHEKEDVVSAVEVKEKAVEGGIG